MLAAELSVEDRGPAGPTCPSRARTVSEPLPAERPAEAVPPAPSDATPRQCATDDRLLLQESLRLSHVGLVQLDVASRRFADVNEGFCRLCGYSADELLAMGPDDLNHPEDPLDLERFQAMLRGQAEYREEKRIVCKDGSARWVEVSGVALPAADGRAARVLGVVQDIDARRRVEQALREREARLDFLLRLDDALRGIDDPAVIAYEAARLLGDFLRVARVGYAEDEGDGEHVVVRRNYVAGVPGIEGRYRYDDYGPALLAAFREGRTVVRPDIAADPTLTSAEKAAHASLQLAATVNVPVLQGRGLQAVFFVHCARPRAWSADEVALIEDVAARIRADVVRARAEAQRRAAQARLATALASMADGMLITNERGEFVDCNEAFLAMHQLASKADIPRSVAEYAERFEATDIAGGSLPPEQWPVPCALRGETGLGREIGLQRVGDDGGPRWIGSHSYAPIRNGGGVVAGAVVSIRDNTELRRIAAELEASHAQLRGLVAALDEVQEQERLRIARELHDELQQSLAVIAMEVGAARTEMPAGGRGALALERIERAARATIAATRRIVQDLRPAVLDELGLVAALAWQAREFTDLTGIDCEFEMADLAVADEARLTTGLAASLYRIAQEALSNVRRHSGASRVALWLGSEPGGRVHLRIRDDGRGIAATGAGMARPAERFGLLGMRERVRATGGSLDITPSPGGGTTIDVVMPLPPPPNKPSA